MDELWERVRAGRHTAVLQASPGEPPAPPGMRVVRVRCDMIRATLGPIREAQRKAEELLGGDAPLLGQARDRMVQGLRRRLLGDPPALDLESAVVDAWNRLARASDRPAALVLEAVDMADDASISMLQRILARPGWLRLPVVLAFRAAAPVGAAAALLETLRSSAGEEGVLRAARASGPHEEPRVFAWRTLPADVLRVLRAGAIVGPGFEADLVAELLDTTTLAVLDAMQRAADAGVPVEDLGEGRFRAPEPLLDELRASMLPSLMIAWHQRLAELLGGAGNGAEAEPLRDAAPEPVAMELDLPPPPADASVTRRLEAEAERAGIVTGERPSEAPPEEPGPSQWPYEEIFPASRVSDAREVAPRPTEASIPPRSGGPVDRARARPEGRDAAEPRASATSTRARADEARAAAHLAAAGDLDASAERYHAAARQAAKMGAYGQAVACAEKALSILDTLPAAPRRRRLRARAMLELGRLKWRVMAPATTPDGLAYEPAFTLAGALETLEGARAALDEEDPPALKAEIAAAVAGVCYDLGDPESLGRALDELTAASRHLYAAGDATGAARLLNDQAAVYVRLGDPVQATHLLTESRKLFEERAASDPVAAIEMAETDHLLARIPLHVAARPGREADALTMGLDHALAAERAYRRLDMARELPRVWETMGRLELKKGRLERARDRLAAAVEAEEASGDLVGLARSTAALSELLAQAGRVEDALAVLADSVALNFEKGSPIGLAFNRRALAALERAAPPSGRAAASLEETRARLEAAERALGAMKLPGEPG